MVGRNSINMTGLGDAAGPMYPEFQSRHSRETTFEGWSQNGRQDPSALVAAGFFYIGDKLLCFYCGGGFEDWQEDHDLWEEHALWFFHCGYLKQVKGTDYIDRIRGGRKICQGRGIIVLMRDSNPISSQQCEIEIRIWESIYRKRGTIGPPFRTYSSRMRTFKDWPLNKRPTPEALVEAGFYFIGIGEEVVCFHCDGGINHWEDDDVPWEEHAYRFKECDFVKKEKGEEYADSLHECRNSCQKDMNISPLTCKHAPILDPQCETEIHTQDTVRKVVIALDPQEPKYPELDTYCSRMRTFKDWPKSKRPIANLLADAGFHFTGNEDELHCFHCGLGLHGWEDDEIPWEEHAYRSKECNFLKERKGEEYSENVHECRNSCQKGGKISILTCKHAPILVPQREIEIRAQKMICGGLGSTTSAIDIHGGLSLSSAAGASTSTAVRKIQDVEEGKCPHCLAKHIPVPVHREPEHSTVSNAESSARTDDVCWKCKAEKADIKFLPCGHVNACHKCNPLVPKCPACNKTRTGFERLELS